MKLLCIDSEPVYQEIVALCAEKLDIQVKAVSTYIDALSAFKDYEPDIVTLDVVMKGGSGIELAKQFKVMSGARFVPIVFLSSNVADSVMDKCFQSGADDFIPKPFNELLFNTRLKTHLNHLQLMQEMYEQNKKLTYFQTVIQREHEMAHHVFNHIQNRSEKDSESVAITRLSAASFNGDLALIKTRSDGTRLVFVGDFTGHGLPASIGALPVMQAFFEAVDDLANICYLSAHINKILYSILPDYMFCAGYLMLISDRGRILYWGGGMPNALIRRKNGQMDSLPSMHMPLGVLSAKEFDVDLEESVLHDGDTLVVLSDGVLELKNSEGLMLGDTNMRAIIERSYEEKSLLVAQRKAEKELIDYLGESTQLDDITLVAIRNAHLS